MKAEVKEITDTNIRVKLASNYSFANSIRRILIGEVPTTAIDFVEIKENKSVLTDEMLANRLGLVPIFCAKQLVMKDECDCDSYCERCSCKLRLKVRNARSEVLPITGKDIVSESSGVVCFGSLIVKLALGQSLDITCIARRDSPQRHAKYSPVTTVGFTEMLRDPLNTDMPVEKAEWAECVGVELDVEVVEGTMKPKDVFIASLEIFRDKLQRIADEIE